MKIKQNNFHSAILMLKATYTQEELLKVTEDDHQLKVFNDLLECESNDRKQ